MLAILIVAMLLTAACTIPENANSKNISTNEETHSTATPYGITYGSISADWPFYQDTQDLVANSTLVVLGKVTNISFQMLDIRTARPVTDETEELYRSLNTIYEIDILEQYKGNPLGSSTQVRMIGGLKDVYLDKQVSILDEDVPKCIPILDDMPEINVGETYLFMLYQYEDTAPTLLNVDQAIFNLDNPEMEIASSAISVRDIISYFGESEWQEFQQTYSLNSEMD